MSQKDTRRCHTRCRGRYAMHAAATTQMMFAQVEAMSRAEEVYIAIRIMMHFVSERG